MAVKIDYDKCCWKDNKCSKCSCNGACSGCVEACPTGALIRESVVKIDNDNCVSCGACVDACKYNAINLID